MGDKDMNVRDDNCIEKGLTAYNGLIDSVKSNGNISINELSKKQVIALVCFWYIDSIKRENSSFTRMLERCYKSTPWHKNAPINYIHADGKTVSTFAHAFYDMTEGEEDMIMKVLKN